ncbi:hypothetical protein B0T17DRAFT_589866 [Bombardia bombarda]|uniref:Heparan-alpha-glucosaminide N-acetyltransferase catalytic domain-containing protein n=1 Tax=Bombardia bombarda TaxID=252184 RepID=A0AA40C9D2_9PEZI|nr:hypothetical protein B0T17DRAFT_589866 [Bombardia bombarda]
MKKHRVGRVTIPPQPDPAVQETAFAADASPELQVLEHEPLPDDGDSSQRAPLSSSATAAAAAAAAAAQPNNYNYTYGSFPTSDERGRPPGPAKSTTRALAPDLLRGLLMVLMALDHNAMALRSWPHGTAVDGEQDSAVVHEWNRPVAYAIRTLTHLCAPGFTFLLGMGVVYFGRSRTNLGWSARRMAWHFLLRAVVLMLVSVVIGLAMTAGDVWFFNIVLFALAVDYLLAGLLWIAMSRTEQTLAFVLLKVLPDGKKDDPTEPLLQDRQGEEDIAPDRTIIRVADISWHVHNAVLFGLAVLTIWWNIWLSPTGGHCQVEHVEMLPESNWFRIWFYPIQGPHVLSGFPPLAWISFAILGLLYGRVILAKSWSGKAITAANAAAGAAFSLVFVLTRLLHFGNLSEGCLQMPEHIQHPGADQYLTSLPSFFYLTKYPPDVAFWSFTMAGNLFLLALLGTLPSNFASRAFKVLLVFGTSALFFYVVHLILLFSMAVGLVAWLGHSLSFKDPFVGGPVVGVDELWAFFLNWALVLAMLYPLCRWYGRFKRTREPDSIWRFF